MKKLLIVLLFFEISLSAFSQIHRKIQIKPFIDTSNIVFKNIYGVLNNYLDTLALYSIKSNFNIKEDYNNLNTFWIIDDLNYGCFPDLSYSIIAGHGGAYYPVMKEYFLGFARRDTNLFEVKTMFVPFDTTVFHNTPNVFITYYITKNGNNYKLCNKLSVLLKNKKLIFTNLNNITYFYSPVYTFNFKNAQKLNTRIESFINGFGISASNKILYFVADNISEIYSWFGIDYYSMDYNSTMSMIEGRSINDRIILSGGGGENYLHEIIHILLKNIRTGNYGYFEEGIACFFGEHVGHNYHYHAARLKNYLKKNSWIDFSQNLTGYYQNLDEPHSYNILNKLNKDNDFRLYADDKSNFTYIIHAVLCDMAFKKGGYDLIKKILMEKVDNMSDFYLVIDKYLHIDKNNLDKEIKDYIIKNF